MSIYNKKTVKIAWPGTDALPSESNKISDSLNESNKFSEKSKISKKKK